MNQFIRLDNNIVYVVDVTPIKLNEYIPNKKIKIFSFDFIKNTKLNFIKFVLGIMVKIFI